MSNNDNYDPNENRATIRESFSGRMLTNAQFNEAVAITGILQREIVKSGSFKDKLGDYAYAMARSERMDVSRAETVLRDLFKARTGQTMNQMREAYAKRDKDVEADAKEDAYHYATGIADIMEDGDKLTFYRVFGDQAEAFALGHGMTDAAAKKLMREVFEETEEQPLIDWGKELDEKFYRPQIEAEKAKRQVRNGAVGSPRNSRTRPAVSQRPAP